MFNGSMEACKQGGERRELSDQGCTTLLSMKQPPQKETMENYRKTHELGNNILLWYWFISLEFYFLV